MNYKSVQLLKAIQTGATILHSRLYTTFLQIPCHILNSNEKIIAAVLMCLSHLTELNRAQTLEFNSDSIAALTGIPLGTINRIMPDIESKIAAAGNWLADRGYTDKISLQKLKRFGTAPFYSFEYIPPVIPQRLNMQVDERAETPAQIPAKRHKNIDKDAAAKAEILLQTKLDLEDLESLKIYPIEKISRNVKYFVERYLNTDKPATLNLLRKTFAHDWGKTYLSDKQKAIEYIKLIFEAAGFIQATITDEKILNAFKNAYKFPPVDINIFNDKSSVVSHFNFKLNSLPPKTRGGIENSIDYYYMMIKYKFPGKTEPAIKESIKHALLQLVHGIIKTDSLKLAA